MTNIERIAITDIEVPQGGRGMHEDTVADLARAMQMNER